jgi:hypothetical protein
MSNHYETWDISELEDLVTELLALGKPDCGAAAYELDQALAALETLRDRR